MVSMSDTKSVRPALAPGRSVHTIILRCLVLWVEKKQKMRPWQEPPFSLGVSSWGKIVLLKNILSVSFLLILVFWKNCWFWFFKSNFFFASSARNMSEKNSKTWASAGYRHDVAANLMESVDANNLPQEYEGNSNPKHVLAFKKKSSRSKIARFSVKSLNLFWISSFHKDLRGFAGWAGEWARNYLVKRGLMIEGGAPVSPKITPTGDKLCIEVCFSYFLCKILKVVLVAVF